MLRSYEATIDDGKLHWVDLAPPLKRARVIVTVLEDKTVVDDTAKFAPENVRQFFASHQTDLSAFKFDRDALYDR